MVKIHGFAYIFIGLFVSFMSWQLNYEKLIFFFYAGWAFVLFGFLKMMAALIKNYEDRKRSAHEIRQKNAAHQHQAYSHHAQRQTQHYKRCPRCGNVQRAHDRFCSHCGFRTI
ncbi:zinc ribbon domain-containing protein [Candidatus Woesearchaeota archaeon]|nr:zinc ribbon domain-containing protein [Candidatus Woesearchaeota archaeon]